MRTRRTRGVGIPCPVFTLQPLERRVMLSSSIDVEGVEPAGMPPALLAPMSLPTPSLTKAERQALLDKLAVGGEFTASIRNALQADLNANNLSSFDTRLLNYMRGRSGPRFFFDRNDVGDIVTHINNNLLSSRNETIARAESLMLNRYPATPDSTQYTVQLTENVNWVSPGTGGSDFLHSLNRHAYLTELAWAFSYTGDVKYVTRLAGIIASWSQSFPSVQAPTSWSANDRAGWLMDTGIRIEAWSWAYWQVLDSPAWTGAANSLFLLKMQQMGEYLANTPPQINDNRGIIHAKGLMYVSRLFPEMRLKSGQAWGGSRSDAQNMLFDAMDAQFFPDGTHREQSPGYAANVINDLLEARLLDNRNSIGWTSGRMNQLRTAMSTFYQMLTPDGGRAAMGNSNRTSAITLFLKADEVLGGDNYPDFKARVRDVWLFGPAVAANYPGGEVPTDLGDRGQVIGFPDGGNYIFRSPYNPPAPRDYRQILFNAGPKGGTHGHFHLFNFELFGYGKPLIADPGRFKPETWRHNTISMDDPATPRFGDWSHGAIEGAGNPAIVVSQPPTSVAGGTMITAYHYGYAYQTGRPVVARSLWFDGENTMVIVDWVWSVVSNSFAVSYTMPGAAVGVQTGGDGSRWIRSNNPDANVKITLLPVSGLQAERRLVQITRGDGSGEEDAYRFAGRLTGTNLVFGTIIQSYTGGTPSTDANWVGTPSTEGSFGVQINGTTVTFTPPSIPRLNPDDGRGTYNGMAYDPQGRLHYAFFDRDSQTLKYTVRHTNGQWSPIEEVDNGLIRGHHPAVAIDGNGRIGIAYRDVYRGALMFASFDPNDPNKRSWEIEEVDVRGSTGHYPSLVFGRGNGPAISYYDKTRGELKLAVRENFGWVIRVVDGGAGQDIGRWSSIQLDPSRPTSTKFAISYEDSKGHKIKYAVNGNKSGADYNASSDFSRFVIDADAVGGYTSLAFDGDIPTVAYYDAKTTSLKFARANGNFFHGSSWTHQTIATRRAGYYSRLVYDAQNRPNIFYFDNKPAFAGTNGRLYHVVRDGNRWIYTHLADGGREVNIARFDQIITYNRLASDWSLRVSDLWI